MHHFKVYDFLNRRQVTMLRGKIFRGESVVKIIFFSFKLKTNSHL